MKPGHIDMPETGEKISFQNGEIRVPENPVIPYMEGDGIGPDIMKAAIRVFDSAVKKACGGKRKVAWLEIFAGSKAFDTLGEYLPEDTLDAIEDFVVAIKGPLTTPVGGGYRSLNVTMRQKLDLYACIRPVRYFSGVPSPLKHPERLNVVIFRENTEDVYVGNEWAAGSEEAKGLIKYLNDSLKTNIRSGSGIGIKPVSEFATKRLMRKAIKYAIEYGRKSITIMHKGNIMKHTEGAFRQWAYEEAEEEFGEVVVREGQDEAGSPGRILIKDRMADSMFQQVLTRPGEYDVIVAPNLNGDYLSDACAAQVGGLGMAPGVNVGDKTAVFEATHGTAPKYANQDKVNPGSLILSGVMMFDYMGWKEIPGIILDAFGKTIMQKKVTYDLARQMEGASELKTSEFASAIINNME